MRIDITDVCFDAAARKCDVAETFATTVHPTAGSFEETRTLTTPVSQALLQR